MAALAAARVIKVEHNASHLNLSPLPGLQVVDNILVPGLGTACTVGPEFFRGPGGGGGALLAVGPPSALGDVAMWVSRCQQPRFSFRQFCLLYTCIGGSCVLSQMRLKCTWLLL